VAPAGFVPGLDPLEDRRGEFARVAHERRSRSSICIEPEKDCETPSMLRGKVVLAGVTHRMTDPAGVLIERYVRQPHRRPRWLD